MAFPCLQEAKKAMLKTTGALWALSAGLDAYGAHEGNMKCARIGRDRSLQPRSPVLGRWGVTSCCYGVENFV